MLLTFTWQSTKASEKFLVFIEYIFVPWAMRRI